MPTVRVDAEIDLYDVDSDDVVEELERRGYTVYETSEADSNIIQQLYIKRKFGQDCNKELDQYLNNILGTAL